MDEQNMGENNESPKPESSEAPGMGSTAPTNMNMDNKSNKGGGDNSSHKAMAVIGYIIPILFFIPLMSEAKNNAFAKFHANQQLNLLIVYVASQVVVIIPVLGWIASPILGIAGIVFAIMGIINATNDRMKELPLIGSWQLMK